MNFTSGARVAVVPAWVIPEGDRVLGMWVKAVPHEGSHTIAIVLLLLLLLSTGSQYTR